MKKILIGVSMIVMSQAVFAGCYDECLPPPTTTTTTTTTLNDSSTSADRAVTVEFLVGLSSRPTFGVALRYRVRDGEAHVAAWDGPQSNVVFGLGAVADTEGKHTTGNDMRHMSGTLGLAYAFNNASEMNGFVPFGRVAAGWQIGNSDVRPTDIELSLSQYGIPQLMKNETLLGIGVRSNHFVDNRATTTTTTTTTYPCGYYGDYNLVSTVSECRQ